MHDRTWQSLSDELARWRDAGYTAELWLRDDDAVEPSTPLERLLAVGQAPWIPITLAVIPAGATQALADRLAGEARVTVAVHGWAHANYAGASEKKQELGPQRPRSIVVAELAKGKTVIDELFGAGALPMLVPPWNRIDAALLPELGGLGFVALSAFGPARAGPVKVINTHVDLMDWHAGRKGKDHATLVGELLKELQARRENESTEPVGILAHHLVHDEMAWSLLNRLFEITEGNAGCRWVDVRAYM